MGHGAESQIGNISTSASPPLKYCLIVMSQPQVPSNPSSEVSIEEIGAEEELAICEKDTNAQEIVTDDSKGPRNTEGNEDEKVAEEAPRGEPTASDQIIGDEKEETPSMAQVALVNSHEEEEDSDEDYDDETIIERILGLTEMFPESVRLGANALASGSVGGVKWLYSMSRSVSWIIFSSSAILFMPIMIETERMGMEEMQKQQQRQILLGPGAAVSGNPPPLPSM